MKTYFSRRLAKAAIFGASLCLTTAMSQAGTYNFTQAGFAGDGTLIGYFTGSDLNNDGFISSSEISDFSATMHGSFYDGFTFGFDWYDHGYYVTPTVGYRIGSHVIGDEAGELLENYTPYQINYVSGSSGAMISGLSSEPVIYSNQLVQVVDPSPVPEPSTWMLMLSGLLLFTNILKRKH